MNDARTVLIAAIVIIAPTAVVMIAAILRGYRINITMRREMPRRRDDDD